MFVTVFIAAIDLESDEMLYANGGHNQPLLLKSGGEYQFMELKKGIPPGMMENSVYKTCSMKLQPGDKLYLYTDGVNEAMNSEGEQWTNERFLAAANKYRALPPAEFDEAIRHEVKAYAAGAEQSDDITSVALGLLELKEAPASTEAASTDSSASTEAPTAIAESTGAGFDSVITPLASVKELDGVLDWLRDMLEVGDCSSKISNQIVVAAEETFVNIASYAYGGKEGETLIRASLRGGVFTLRFEDGGAAFNPLEREPPDLADGAAAERVGGLGIFLTRKWMDTVVYERAGDKNILTLTKSIK
jgi:sigma-B regulation protein RsbU (phosphoserine phosphatase)